MTILHVSDLHFNRRWFNWLADNAPAHDLLVVAGDLLNHTDDTTRLGKQIEWVSDWIRAYPHPLCVCSGPHDLEWSSTVGRWTPAYWLREIDDPTVWADGRRLTFGAHSILNIGYTTRPKGGDADIWVVHTPPRGTSVATHLDGRDAGDEELAMTARHYTPRLILSGGVHDATSWCDELGSTLCLNPGREPDVPYPNHIVVNTNDLSCRFFSAVWHVARMDSFGGVPAAPAAMAASGRS